MKIVHALLLLCLTVGEERAHAEGGAFAPSGVCRADTAFGPSPAFLNFSAANTTAGQSRINCGLGRLSTTSPTRVFVDYYDASAAKNLTCQLSVTAWSDSQQTLYYESHTSSGVGTSFFVFTIPSTAIGYVTVLCDLPVQASGEPFTRFYGVNFL